jgi:hypothetical protein
VSDLTEDSAAVYAAERYAARKYIAVAIAAPANKMRSGQWTPDLIELAMTIMRKIHTGATAE